MAILVADRVKDTTTTTGTGNITLAGAPATGFQAFSAAFPLNKWFYYAIVDNATGAWELGIGLLTATTTLVRTRVLRSTNSNNAVNFSAGTKDVFSTSPADYLNDTETRGRVTAMVRGAVML